MLRRPIETTPLLGICHENLAALFADIGLEIKKSGDRFTLLGLSESQLRLCADILTDGK